MAPNNARTPSLHPCVDCSRRKVKCDRAQPCTNCVKYGVECRQPDAHREPRRPRRARDSAMLDRIQQLERSLLELKSHLPPGAPGASIPTTSNPGLNPTTSSATTGSHALSAGESPETDGQASSNSTATETSPAPVHTPPPAYQSIQETEKTLPDAMGRLFIDEGKERYISGGSWANLANDVADLRMLFEEREKRADYAVQEDFATEALIPPLPLDAEPFLPTLDEKRRLWQVYVQNVDPIIKLLHIPDWTKVMEASWVNPSAVDRSTQSLICAINFSAITSLSEEACERIFGRSRDWLLRKTRDAVRTALRAANFLSAQQSITLKAFIIFLVCNRRHEEPRVSWIMCGAAFRIAQSLGLHRDGTVMKISPYHVQDRRRIWWLLRMLDAACAEDCGFMPTQIYGEDTRIPLNVNDSDISQEATELPSPKDEFCDVTFSIMRYSINSYMPKIHQQVSDAPHGFADGGQVFLSEASKLVEQKEQWMEEHLFRLCDPQVPMQRFAIGIGKIILTKLWLVVHIPAVRGEASISATTKALRDRLFVKSCEIIEMGKELRLDPETQAWTWLLETYMEWHPVAYLLSELARTPAHEMRVRGWQAIDEAITRSHGVTIDLRRAQWRPLIHLLEKAEAAAKATHRNTSPPIFPDLQRQLRAVNLPGMPGSSTSMYNEFDFLGLPEIAASGGIADSGFDGQFSQLFGPGEAMGMGGPFDMGTQSQQATTDWWIPGSPGT